jgi:opacity protein-like surface antigen
MKKLLLFALAMIISFGVIQAGEPTVSSDKNVAPPPPPNYGVGFYGGVILGANAYQNLPSGRTFTEDNPNSPFFGESLEVSPQNNVGFFGGLKLGYVFGTGTIRPTVELDSLYNGFDTGTNFTLREADGDLIRSSSSSNRLNSGVWLGNFILRFAPGDQKFQPYVGGGIGIYYAELAGLSFTGPRGETFNTGGGASHSDLAFDIVAGADYFFTPKFSAFVEYKFLEYTSTQWNTNQNRALGQQLVGAGVRFFFQ